MSINEWKSKVGHTVYVEVFPGVIAPFTVLDVRRMFDRIEVQVSPRGGSGEVWKNTAKLQSALPA